MLWVVNVELWMPAELSSQVEHTTREDQLGAAAPKVARVIKLCASTLACSQQPVLGRQPLLLWCLDCFLWGQVAISVGEMGLLGQIQRNSGAAPLLLERLCPGRSPGMLRQRV